MKGILKSRRGAAIESAIFFMLVALALSMLLVASVTSMGYRNLADENTLDTRLGIEQIGHYFVTDNADLLAEYAAACGYTPTVTDRNGTSTLTVTSKSGKTVLYIEKADNTILCWRYEAPATE